MASFGVGAALVTLMWLLGLTLHNKLCGDSWPLFHFTVLRGPGSLAGLFWCCGSFCTTAGVVSNGNATSMPCTLAVSIVTSGAFGVFYYKEMTSWRAFVWGLFVLWTLSSMILLSLQKA